MTVPGTMSNVSYPTLKKAVLLVLKLWWEGQMQSTCGISKNVGRFDLTNRLELVITIESTVKDSQ